MCLQDAVSRKTNRKKTEIKKESLLLETKKQVMSFKLRIKEQLDQVNREQLIGRRAERRARDANNKGGLDYNNQDRDAYSDSDELLSDNEYMPNN